LPCHWRVDRVKDEEEYEEEEDRAGIRRELRAVAFVRDRRNFRWRADTSADGTRILDRDSKGRHADSKNSSLGAGLSSGFIYRDNHKW
jgi:hypothetical protein